MIDLNLIKYFTADWHLGCFYFATLDDAAFNLSVHVLGTCDIVLSTRWRAELLGHSAHRFRVISYGSTPFQHIQNNSYTPCSAATISVILNSQQNLALSVKKKKKPTLVIPTGVYWHLSEVFICLPLIIMRLNTFCLLAFEKKFDDYFTTGWGLRS